MIAVAICGSGGPPLPSRKTVEYLSQYACPHFRSSISTQALPLMPQVSRGILLTVSDICVFLSS